MSRIYFHTKEDTAGVSGAERASFSVFCEQIATSFLDRYADGGDPLLLQLFPEDHYVRCRAHRQAQDVLLAFRHLEDFVINGEKMTPFELFLNTAFALGNDAVKLAARIHGQCEIHCWAKDENRQWLASIIKHGLKIGMYREGMGWDGVIGLLESSDDSHVVLSYSVCEMFPNQHVADYQAPMDGDEIDYEAWYELDSDERWRLGIEGLISAGNGLELMPDNWNDFYFDNGYTAMQLINDLSKLRQ